MIYSNELILGVLVAALCGRIAVAAPNIVFVLLDDVGWSDLNREAADSPIPTPFIDNLTARGVHLNQHYVHSVCTPSRASLMTGRYHVNTGLTNVLIPGTPAGLPSDIATLPSLLSCLGGYSTAMAGKWHLGHAQHKMTPIGRGFDYFTGMYMWDLDSYTKEMYEIPWEAPLLIDWVTEERVYTDAKHTSTNQSECEARPYTYKYRHYAEPHHATEAITTAADTYMRQHAERDSGAPMFMYVAYTAAHSPLQPLPRHAAHCQHISHSRRRDYCGLVVGLDEALRNLTASIITHLGDDTILVVASDNGGAAYFGGMNAPLRGAKGTPFEGGVRVPAFIVDLSPTQQYLGLQVPVHKEAAPVPVPEPVPEPVRSEGEADVDSTGDSTGETEVAAEVSADATVDATVHAAAVAEPEVTYEIPAHLRPTKPVDVTYSRVFHGMMHMSDWLPTLLTYANVPKSRFPGRLDGFDFTAALRGAGYEDATTMSDMCQGNVRDDKAHSTSPRNSVLLEYYDSTESVFNQTLAAHRVGDYKLILGTVRDENYYFESTDNKVNSSHPSLGSHVIETIVDALDYFCGQGQSDTLNIVLVHMYMHDVVAMTDRFFPRVPQMDVRALPAPEHPPTDGSLQKRLYNVARDPCERVNLAADPQYASIIAEIEEQIAEISRHRPPTLPMDLQLDISGGGPWHKTHKKGDCSADPSISEARCLFTHSWVPDDANPMEQEGLMHAHIYMYNRAVKLVVGLLRPVLAGVSVLAVAHFLYTRLFGAPKKVGLLRRK